MRHEYLSVYQLENDTINSNTINVDEIAVGGGGLVTKEWDFAVDGNTSGTYDIFTITGAVRAKLLALCNTGPAGGGATAQITFGISGAETVFMGQTTAQGVDSGEFWVSASNSQNLTYVNVNTIKDRLLSGATSPLKLVITSCSTSTGKITFYCWWEPLTTGAAVEAA